MKVKICDAVNRNMLCKKIYQQDTKDNEGQDL